MIRTAKYVNHNGREVNLKGGGIQISSTGIPDWELTPITSNGRVMRFRNEPKDKAIAGIVFSQNAEESLAKRRELYLTAAEDLVQEGNRAPKPGRLYVNGAYMPGYVRASSKDRFWFDDCATDITLTFYSADPLWRVPREHVFRTTDETEGLDFPYDFDYDLGASGSGSKTVDNDSPLPSPVVLTVYGPVHDPAVMIDGNLYAVECNLRSGDRLVMDGDAKKVTIYDAYGVEENVFDRRIGSITDGTGQCIFHKVSKGQHAVEWDGSFALKVTLYELSHEYEW